MSSAKTRWQVYILGIVSCLSCCAYADSYAQYGATIDKAFYELATGQTADALAGLEENAELFAGDVEYETLLSIALLENKQYDKAQLSLRGLALQLGKKDEADVKHRVLRIYSALWVARDAEGFVLPLSPEFYSDMDYGQRLNVNFNRRLLGLPYIGAVIQWKTFDWRGRLHPVDQAQFVPKPKPATLAPNGSVRPASPGAALALARDVDLTALLAEAKQQLASAQPAEAFATLQPYEFEGAGDVEFDYVMGTAAVDAGAADEAIFILSRVLNQKPNHAGARLELARAYYANGDYEDSKEQFETVLQQSPPPKAKALSERYLVAINDQLANKLKSFIPYVEARVGYDSNANGATSVEQPFSGINGVSTAIQGLTLNQQSLETPSAFLAFAGGAAYSNQFKPRYFFRAGGQLEARSNERASFVNTQAAKGFANFEYRQGNKVLGAGLDASHSYVGGDFSANAAGLSVFGGKELAANWVGNAQLRVALQRYESDQDAKDSTDYTLAVSATRSWDGPNRLATTYGLILQDVNAKTDVNSKQVYGAQASFNFVAFDSTLFTISAVGIQTDFDAPIVGTDDRTDRSYLLGFGLTRFSGFDPNLKWLFNLDATLTESTLALYDSDGVKASVGVRYDFR